MNLQFTYAAIFQLLQSGRPLQAEQMARDALRVWPHDESLLQLLAMSFQNQQRLESAIPIYAELIRLCPASGMHWSNYGSVLSDAGQLSEAKAAYQRALELDPANVVTRDLYGLLLIDCREYLGAREVLLEACRLADGVQAIHVHAARACCLCQDFDTEAELLRYWRAWLPINDDILQLDLAQVLAMLNDGSSAAWLLEDMLIRQPDHVDAKLLLIGICERQNRLKDAEALAKEIATSSISSPSQFNELIHVLASLSMRRKDFTGAYQLLKRAGPQGEDDIEHYFLLASVCDKLAYIPEALNALENAHRISVKLHRFDSPEYFSADTPAMPCEVQAVDADQYRRWPLLIAPSMRDSPIFVVGFPRSGTTLLEQMLDAHPQLQSMDENPFFNRLAQHLRNHDERIMQDLSVLRQYDCDELRKRYLVMVGERIERNWDARLVDKNPLNMQWLSMIHRLYPAAKIILAIRHPCDVILSCYMQHFRSSALAAACSSLERLARAYVQTMQQWLADVELFKPDLLVSRYEDLVTDFPRRAEAIARFLELDDVTPMLQFDQHARGKSYIATPSYSQVIEPINRKAVARWERYRQAFEPILPILKPMLEHWGYVDAPEA